MKKNEVGSLGPRGGKKEYTCKRCGKIFVDFISIKRVYCSKVCHNKSQIKRKRKYIICPTCGKRFKAIEGDKKFCSKTCHIKYLRVPENNPNYGNIKWTRESIIEELRRVAKKLNKTPYSSDWRMEGNDINVIYKYFERFSDALKAAGFPTRRIWTPEPPLKNIFDIYYDSRERQPYIYASSKRMKLDVGDYKCDLCPNIRVERKSKGDFVSTVTGGRNRFKRELERARKNNLYVIILVECSIDDILKRRYYAHRKVHPNTVLHFAKEIASEYKDVCQIIYADDRDKGRLLLPFLFSLGNTIGPEIDLQEFTSRLTKETLIKTWFPFDIKEG